MQLNFSGVLPPQELFAHPPAIVGARGQL